MPQRAAASGDLLKRHFGLAPAEPQTAAIALAVERLCFQVAVSLIVHIQTVL
jgi:hypothetical protein